MTTNAIKPDDVNPRTRVVGPLTPISNADTEPTHFSDFAYGGLRTVENVTERDAIPAARRVVGMVVYQADTKTYYTLETGIADSNWVIFNPGSGTSFHAVFTGTIGTDSTTDWILVTGSTADYTRDFIHGFGTNDIEYVIYDENNNFVFACVSQESDTRLRITVNSPVTTFAGRITINKEG